MCEVDCPRALLKIFKLPPPFGRVSRCVMFADLLALVVPCVAVPRWCLCLAGCVVCVLCVRVCVYARASAYALCVLAMDG